MAQPQPKRYIIGISGASGALYARRVIRLLLDLGHEVHLVVTPPGARLLHDELGMEGVDLPTLIGATGPDDPRLARIVKYNHRDIGAAIASGSFRHDGMAVVPCSAHTLNAIACGLGENLLTRAAACTLKERRRLIIAHRETPLTLIDIEHMRTLTMAGAIICPTNPGFYLLPRTIEEIVDFMAGKVLDLLGVEHGLSTRWEEHAAAGDEEADDSAGAERA